MKELVDRLHERLGEVIAKHEAQQEAKENEEAQRLAKGLQWWMERELGAAYAKLVTRPSITLGTITLEARMYSAPDGNHVGVYYVSEPCPNCGKRTDAPVDTFDGLAWAVKHKPSHWCPPTENAPRTTPAEYFVLALVGLLHDAGYRFRND